MKSKRNIILAIIITIIGLAEIVIAISDIDIPVVVNIILGVLIIGYGIKTIFDVYKK